MWPLYLPTHTLQASSAELPIRSEPVPVSLSMFASLPHPVNLLQSPPLLYLKGRTGLFLLHAPTLSCKWSNRSVSHAVCPFIPTCMHCYHVQSTLSDKLWGLKADFIQTPPAHSTGISGEEHRIFFFFCHLFTCLIGHLFEPDGIPDPR